MNKLEQSTKDLIKVNRENAKLKTLMKISEWLTTQGSLIQKIDLIHFIEKAMFEVEDEE